MSVVAKAIELLSHFSVRRPELGLSQLCRLAKRDKATTYRHLTALEALGFLEQNPVTKAYRIGPAVLHLADIREATVPRRDGAMVPLRLLAEQTGETAHVSVLSGVVLHAMAHSESTRHSTRAVIDLQTLPLHATASGICLLAFGSDELRHAALSNLTPFTQNTPTSEQRLDAAIAAAKAGGFGESDRAFEDEIYSLAAPVYDRTGEIAGAVAVASVASRITPDAALAIKKGLAQAAHDISHNWGGSIPEEIQTLWRTTLHPTSRDIAQKVPTP